jgi:hypothetical protein
LTENSMIGLFVKLTFFGKIFSVSGSGARGIYQKFDRSFLLQRLFNCQVINLSPIVNIVNTPNI